MVETPPRRGFFLSLRLSHARDAEIVVLAYHLRLNCANVVDHILFPQVSRDHTPDRFTFHSLSHGGPTYDFEAGRSAYGLSTYTQIAYAAPDRLPRLAAKCHATDSDHIAPL